MKGLKEAHPLRKSKLGKVNIRTQKPYVATANYLLFSYRRAKLGMYQTAQIIVKLYLDVVNTKTSVHKVLDLCRQISGVYLNAASISCERYQNHKNACYSFKLHLPF